MTYWIYLENEGTSNSRALWYYLVFSNKKVKGLEYKNTQSPEPSLRYAYNRMNHLILSTLPLIFIVSSQFTWALYPFSTRWIFCVHTVKAIILQQRNTSFFVYYMQANMKGKREAIKLSNQALNTLSQFVCLTFPKSPFIQQHQYLCSFQPLNNRKRQLFWASIFSVSIYCCTDYRQW